MTSDDTPTRRTAPAAGFNTGRITSRVAGWRERSIRAVGGTLLARPWFDRAAFVGLKSLFFPLSRLWAAAREANGDWERYFEAVPMPPRLEHRQRLVTALARFETRRASVNAIEAEWNNVFFVAADAPESYRVSVENARRELRHAYNATRGEFRFLLGRNVPRVKLDIATPASVAATWDAALSDLGPFVAPPEQAPAIAVSKSIPCGAGHDFWLRFQSPSARLGDTVYARVHEPIGAKDPPTILYGHGICVEFDHWKGLIDECQTLVERGFRVIRPEAPWHGRRVTPGSFGGEAIIARFPAGALDAVTGALREWAVLARWARETSRGPLVFAGSSLGAMTSQLAADRARDWPQAIRPDAMLLVTHTGDLAEAVIHGALSRLFASRDEIAALGWTEDMARRYLSLLSPTRPPVVPPERIVSILGSRDDVLPFDSGRGLVERWGLPSENVFVWDRGHFSVPMTLAHNDAPLERLSQIVASL